MSMRDGANQGVAFADVVSVDAWHTPFNAATRLADLHADVVFGLARLGGDASSPVRFRIQVRRAEVVIVVPPTEPLTIVPHSVERGPLATLGTITDRTQDRKSAKATGLLSITQAGVAGQGSVKGERDVEHTTIVETQQAIRPIISVQSLTAEGFYRWSLRPQIGRCLTERPWDPSQRRLQIKDTRSEITRGLAPTARVEVRCRREDLDIHDLRIKDANVWATVRNRTGFKTRLAAAEGYIRNKLFERGLEAASISDPFAQLTLASVAVADRS